MFREHGVELSVTDWAGAIGTAGAFDVIAHLEGLLGRSVDGEAIRRRRAPRKQALCDAELARPGVDRYLERAAELGLETAIVSSDRRSWVVGHLERIGLVNRWHSIHCGEMDPSRTKPRPDLYLEALDAIGLAPMDAIAFEDSPNGIAAAKAAGLFCVAVPNPVTSQLDLSRADVLVRSLADMELDELLELTEATATG